MKATGFLVFLVLATATGQRGGGPILEIHDRGAVRIIDEKSREEIGSQALRLLESSNFNSLQHRDLLKATPQRTHESYRGAVAGRYLVVCFEAPRRIKTIGGEVEVLEVVIGLNRSDYADSLFTIDGEGRVVSHAKYSGAEGVELLRKVDALRPGD